MNNTEKFGGVFNIALESVQRRINEMDESLNETGRNMIRTLDDIDSGKKISADELHDFYIRCKFYVEDLTEALDSIVDDFSVVADAWSDIYPR